MINIKLLLTFQPAAAKQKPAATADVEQLERSFAAPAVEKQHQHQHEQQQHQPEQLDVQPASKRQKRGATQLLR